MGWVIWSGIKDPFDPDDYASWSSIQNFVHRTRKVFAILFLLILFYALFERL